MIRNKVGFYLSLALVLPIMLAGCGGNKNLFAPMHSDGVESNPIVLVADGKAALARGDYTNAEKYFKLAMEHGPTNAEARVGYAEAFLKTKGFSLGKFTTGALDMMNSSSSSSEAIKLLSPEDWGVADFTELEAVLVEVINTLDPIAQGQTDGTIKATDVDVNLTAGLFYVLRFALEIEQLLTSFEIKTVSKTSPEVVALGLPTSILDQLPDEFLWFFDDLDQQPDLSVIGQIESLVDTGMVRLRVAAANSASGELITQVIDMFADWEVLADQ